MWLNFTQCSITKGISAHFHPPLFVFAFVLKVIITFPKTYGTQKNTNFPGNAFVATLFVIGL